MNTSFQPGDATVTSEYHFGRQGATRCPSGYRTRPTSLHNYKKKQIRLQRYKQQDSHSTTRETTFETVASLAPTTWQLKVRVKWWSGGLGGVVPV